MWLPTASATAASPVPVKVRSTFRLTLSCVVLVMVARVASAQSGATLAVGAGLNVYRPASDSAHIDPSLGVVYRWISERSGWRPSIGFNWYTVNVSRPVGAAISPQGELRLRPF